MIKRPTNSYTIFYQEKFAELRANNPTIGVTQLGKIAGEMYRNLSAEERQRYTDLSKKDHERYDEEKKAALKVDPRSNFVTAKSQKKG